MLIYVCSPYSGQVELNVAKASNYSKYVVDAGHTPIAPHLLFPQFLNDDIPEERNRAIQMNMENNVLNRYHVLRSKIDFFFHALRKN